MPSVAPVGRRAGHGADGFRNQHGYLSPIRALLLWRAWSHHVVFSPVWNYAAESRRQKLNGKCNDKYRPHPQFWLHPSI